MGRAKGTAPQTDRFSSVPGGTGPSSRFQFFFEPAIFDPVPNSMCGTAHSNWTIEINFARNRVVLITLVMGPVSIRISMNVV